MGIDNDVQIQAAEYLRMAGIKQSFADLYQREAQQLSQDVRALRTVLLGKRPEEDILMIQIEAKRFAAKAAAFAAQAEEYRQKAAILQQCALKDGTFDP